MTEQTFPPLLSVQQAAEAASVSPSTIRRLVQRGELPATKVGVARNSPVRIPADALRRWLWQEPTA